MLRKILLLVSLLMTGWGMACHAPAKPDTADPPQQVLATPVRGMTVLRFTREGGIAGLCDNMSVYDNGMIEYSPCGRPPRTATLTQSERKELTEWIEQLGSFDVKQEDNSGGVDNLVRAIEFAGRGTTPANAEHQQELLAWTERIYNELTGQPQPGSVVSSVGQVLDVLNKQVIVINPEVGDHDLILVTPQTTFTLANGKPTDLSAVLSGTRIKVQGKALGAGGLQAETIIIEPSQ